MKEGEFYIRYDDSIIGQCFYKNGNCKLKIVISRDIEWEIGRTLGPYDKIITQETVDKFEWNEPNISKYIGQPRWRLLENKEE